MNFLFAAVIGYLIGSVPFAYVIGKAFYHTDVRQHGSGNLGGSNTGRVLGVKAGLAVMTLDLLKVTLSVLLTRFCSQDIRILCCAALAAAIGHCYPVFVHFRGGKAVAPLYGFLFALWIFTDCTALVFFVPLITFLLVLAACKIVSLSSILSSLAAVCYVWLSHAPVAVICSTAVFAVIVILRHHSNIRRMLNGTERKIRWMK